MTQGMTAEARKMTMEQRQQFPQHAKLEDNAKGFQFLLHFFNWVMGFTNVGLVTADPPHRVLPIEEVKSLAMIYLGIDVKKLAEETKGFHRYVAEQVKATELLDKNLDSSIWEGFDETEGG